MRFQASFYRFSLFLLVFALVSCKTQKHVSSGISSEEAALKKKYAGLLAVQESEITNMTLYKFIDS